MSDIAASHRSAAFNHFKRKPRTSMRVLIVQN
jgi:hypothetical protein